MAWGVRYPYGVTWVWSLNLSGFNCPQYELDVANLSLEVGMQSVVFFFPSVTMTVVLSHCESLTLFSIRTTLAAFISICFDFLVACVGVTWSVCCSWVTFRCILTPWDTCAVTHTRARGYCTSSSGNAYFNSVLFCKAPNSALTCESVLVQQRYVARKLARNRKPLSLLFLLVPTI